MLNRYPEEIWKWKIIYKNVLQFRDKDSSERQAVILEQLDKIMM
jgi:hypothetical protein